MMRDRFYKVVDLFGNETVKACEKQTANPNLFGDYDAFVEKFEAKKTTDDCYTPEDVYKTVLGYVNEQCDLKGKQIIRPFYPGGDYEHIAYPDNGVVVDNPPFSIISQIAQFYIKKGIPFFLFAPHLTLFGSDIDCTHIVAGGDIIYENGASVKTSFLSNMFGDTKVIGDAELVRRLKQLNEAKKVNLPKYVYPTHVLTVSHVQWMLERGVSIQIGKEHTRHCRALQSQKAMKKAIFGSGFLLSDEAAAEKAAAEKAAAEKAAAEKENVIVWQISKQERAIIDTLG